MNIKLCFYSQIAWNSAEAGLAQTKLKSRVLKNFPYTELYIPLV